VSALDHGRQNGEAECSWWRGSAAVRARAETRRAFVTGSGATTAFFAADDRRVQNDIKRIVAYSYLPRSSATCSWAHGHGRVFVSACSICSPRFLSRLMFLGPSR